MVEILGFLNRPLKHHRGASVFEVPVGFWLLVDLFVVGDRL